MLRYTLPLAILLGVPAAAQTPDEGSRTVIGMGNGSCAAWLADPYSEQAGKAWIGGYISGANDLNQASHAVGKHTDAPGIFAEVKGFCQASPSMTLFAATQSAYAYLMALKR